MKEEDDGDEGQDDEGDDESEEDNDEPRGFVAPATNTCVAISGTVSFGIQRDWLKASARTNAATAASASSGVTSFPLTASFRIETGRILDGGLFLGSAFEMSLDGGSGGESATTLVEASVTIGPWVFGAASSRFDFWTGEDFIFTGRIPSRTVGIIAYERTLIDPVRVSISAEDTQIDSRALPSRSGRRVPDGVARIVYDGDALTLHGAVALRELPAAGQAKSRLGHAIVLGATWQGDLLGQGASLSAQLIRAVDAATYLGSKLDRAAVRSFLTVDDTTKGWSGLVAIGRDWSEHWSTNIYASRYELTLPQLGARSSRIMIDRLAANLVWKPVKGFKIGIEASAARQKADLVGREAAAALAARQVSVQLFLERSF
jgi:hypothetical protein